MPSDAVDGRTATLLALADGRFPSGGHAHSGGVEAAVADGRITGTGDLGAFLDGRLATTGRTDAAAAAWAVGACATDDPGEALAALDAELGARTPSPALRDASRRQGRQLWRAASRVWPGPGADRLSTALAGATPGGPHLALAHGVAAAVAGLDATGAALCSAHAGTAGAATAAVRLLGLDPFAVHALVAARAGAHAAVAERAAAVAAAAPSPHLLPGPSGPLVELAADRHRATEVRLFAS